MKIYLASSNKGKIKEIKALLNEYEVIAYSDVIEPFDIVEDADSFKANAIIKAQAVYEALKDKEALVLADDSGISIQALDNAPGIYSARYAGAQASDKENLQKAIDELEKKSLKSSPAFYTAAMALCSQYGCHTVHGWMHGSVTTTPRGEKGFGYDPIFIPEGYDKTLGELDESIKAELSHRSQALRHVKQLLKGMKL